MAGKYKIKELFYTIQGEGAQTGRPAVFIRFSGCNLWSGREEDRADAICAFCDTDFRGTDGIRGGTYTAEALTIRILEVWGDKPGAPFIVVTGGEPLLQLDATLIQTLHAADIEIAIETNGTIAVPAGIDWICVSPKAGATMVQCSGNELKIVYPQAGLNPLDFETLNFEIFSLQPMYDDRLSEHTAAAVEFCLQHPKWRLSIQTHKILGLP